MPKHVLFLCLCLFIFLSGCRREVQQLIEPDLIPPSPPQGLYVYFAGDGMVILIWQNNRESDLAFYKIYRSTDSVNFSFIAQTYENIYAY